MISNFTVKKTRRKKQQNRRYSIFHILLVFLALLAIFSLTPIGANFLVGVFGILFYPLVIITSLVCVAKIRKIKYRFHKKFFILQCLAIFCVFQILQLGVTHNQLGNEYGPYLMGVYEGITPGGLFFSWFTWCIAALLSPAGAYIFFTIVFAFVVGFIVEYFYGKNQGKKIMEPKQGYGGQQEVFMEDGKVVAKESEMGVAAGAIGFDADTADLAEIERKLGLNKDEERKMKDQEIMARNLETIKQEEIARSRKEQEALRTILGLNRKPEERGTPGGLASFRDIIKEERQTGWDAPTPNQSGEFINTERIKERNLRDALGVSNNETRRDPRMVRPEKVVMETHVGDDSSSYDSSNFVNYGEEGIISDSNRKPLEQMNTKPVYEEKPDNSGIMSISEGYAKAEEVVEEPYVETIRQPEPEAVFIEETIEEETVEEEVVVEEVAISKAEEEKARVRDIESELDKAINSITSEDDDFTKEEIKDVTDIVEEEEYTYDDEYSQLSPEEEEFNQMSKEEMALKAYEEQLARDREKAEEPRTESSSVTNFDEPIKDITDMIPDQAPNGVMSERAIEFRKRFQVPEAKPRQTSFAEVEPKEKKGAPKFYNESKSPYNRPPVELLKHIEIDESTEENEEWFEQMATRLENTLAGFNVPVTVTNIVKGPAVTRYELQIQPGIPVKRIQQYANDIAMNMEANGGIRIETPIPGKNAVGIEVPNIKITPVPIRDVIDSPEFKRSNPLAFALGKDIAGTTMLCDIVDMPHLLIAGSTGSGKSVCLNALLVSLIYKMSPKDLKIILIDPKRVEFPSYNGLPHLIMPQAIIEPKDAINALGWATQEMDRRYQLFHSVGARDIRHFNNREEVRSGKEPKLPSILIVIDELADLMQTGKREVEDRIKRLTALARAAGMHLIVATQRPSVDVLTGTIKVNLPSRIAFAVTSMPDSKTILDQGGAENLLGKGDMLYSPQSFPDPKRVQGAYISTDEVTAVVEYIKQNNDAYFDEELIKDVVGKEEPKVEMAMEDLEDEKNKFDPLLPEALKLAIETGQASISMIQRRFAVGYAKAARIIDQMEQATFISPHDGSRARRVFATMDDFNLLFPDHADR